MLQRSRRRDTYGSENIFRTWLDTDLSPLDGQVEGAFSTQYCIENYRLWTYQELHTVLEGFRRHISPDFTDLWMVGKRACGDFSATKRSMYPDPMDYVIRSTVVDLVGYLFPVSLPHISDSMVSLRPSNRYHGLQRQSPARC